MESFLCPICSSSGSIEFNETNIPCSHCCILPISNEDLYGNNLTKLCNDCGKSFDSNAEFGQHKKKMRCSLEKYGCRQQIDLCSMDQHLCDASHTRAIQLYILRHLPINLNFSKDLTECLSRNENNIRIRTITNNELDSFDESKLILDFDAALTNEEIQNDDQNLLTDQQRQILANNQLIRYEQTENLIEDRLNDLNRQQEDNISILEEQTIISNIQQQFQICHLCEKEYNILLESRDDLQEKVSKLSLEIEEQKQINEDFIHFNELLTFQTQTLDNELSNTPHSKNGLLIWCIDNITEKISESYSHRNCPINSPRFLSLTGEHPLNVQLFLYGDSFDDPNYISIYILLNPGGKNNLSSIPLICCLVDQTNHYQHIIQRTEINLNPNGIGIIYRFPQFVQTIDVHKENSPFVKNDVLCLIIKLHEDELNQHNHYSPSIQNALEKINLLTLL